MVENRSIPKSYKDCTTFEEACDLCEKNIFTKLKQLLIKYGRLEATTELWDQREESKQQQDDDTYILESDTDRKWITKDENVDLNGTHQVVAEITEHHVESDLVFSKPNAFSDDANTLLLDMNLELEREAITDSDTSSLTRMEDDDGNEVDVKDHDIQKPLSGMDHTTSPSIQQSTQSEVRESMFHDMIIDVGSCEILSIEGNGISETIDDNCSDVFVADALEVFDGSTVKEEGDCPYGKVYHTQNTDYIVAHKVFDESSQRTCGCNTIGNGGQTGLKTTYEHNHIVWDPGKHAFYEGSKGAGKRINFHSSKDRLVGALKLFDEILNKERGTNKDGAYQHLLNFLFRPGLYDAAGLFFTPRDIGEITCLFVITTLGMYDHSLAIQLVFDVVFIPDIILWKEIMNGYDDMCLGYKQRIARYKNQLIRPFWTAWNTTGCTTGHEVTVAESMQIIHVQQLCEDQYFGDLIKSLEGDNGCAETFIPAYLSNGKGGAPDTSHTARLYNFSKAELKKLTLFTVESMYDHSLAIQLVDPHYHHTPAKFLGVAKCLIPNIRAVFEEPGQPVQCVGSSSTSAAGAIVELSVWFLVIWMNVKILGSHIYNGEDNQWLMDLYVHHQLPDFMFRQGHYEAGCPVFFSREDVHSPLLQSFDRISTHYTTIDKLCDLCIGYGAMTILEEVLTTSMSSSTVHNANVQHIVAATMGRICIYGETQSCSSGYDSLSSCELLQPRPVSTGLGLSLSNGYIASSSSGSSLLSFIGDDIDQELRRHDAEIDTFLKVQGDRFKQGIMEMVQANQLKTMSNLQEKVLQKIREKEAEVDRINMKNIILEEQLEKLSMEASAWQQRAQYNENMIATLNYNLQQVHAQTRDSKEGCGDSEADDAASCCNGAGALDFQLLSKESGELKQLMTCRGCQVNQACMLLLPCKHLCLCKGCESKLSFCPLCQASKFVGVEVYV